MPRPKPPTPPIAEARTRERLLEAAGEVFAEVGFRNATIREICTKAGANIAAVNYHFGDKEALYAAVLVYAQTCARERYPIQTPDTSPPQERLRAFINAFMLRLLDQGRPAWHGRLMAREMVEPTAALDSVIESSIRPNSDALTRLIADILGAKPADERVQLCATSVIAQCMIYRNCQPVLERLWPKRKYTAATIAALSEHVYLFSMAALASLRRPAKGASR